jgi:glutaredoxin
MAVSDPEVVVYSGPGCAPCEQVKRFLTERGVSYDVRNVRDNRDYLMELRDLGYLSVPVTVIRGQVIKGFDLEKLEAALVRPEGR